MTRPASPTNPTNAFAIGESLNDISLSSSSSCLSLVSSHHDHEAGSSYADDTNPSADNKPIKENRTLVWKESQNVWRSKILAFLVIVVVGIAGSVATFFLVRKSEEAAYELNFESYAKEVGAASQSKVITSFSVVGMLSESLTNAALISNQTWPYFTHPYFDKIGGQAVKVSQVEAIAIAPLVPKSEKEEWEKYTQANKGWLQTGLESRGLGDTDPGPIPPLHKLNATTFEHPPGTVDGFGDYLLPVWQIAAAPTNATIINTDLFTNPTFEHTVSDVVGSKQPVLAIARNSNLISEFSVSHNFSNPNEVREYGSHLVYPINETFDSETRVVALLFAAVPWSM